MRMGPGRVLMPMVLALATAAPGRSAEEGTTCHPLTLEDVLDRQRIERATLSPDGEWVAAVISRPARAGEVYGRASYEVDPSRTDVWLISTRTGERRALTNGSRRAAGYWCATWSPDGQRLAMLSTAPEGKEPRGGDNVRLYVWERKTRALRRIGDATVMTQTRYGSPRDQLDLRGGADRSTVAHRCADGAARDNAGFLWLDAHRLLVATLPPGEVAALIDHDQRPVRTIVRDALRLHEGREPTGSTVASGAARPPLDTGDARARLQVIDVATRRAQTVAAVPAYPFRGALAVSVSPDGGRLAILATLGALRPEAGRRFPNLFDESWTIERRLGFVDLSRPGPIRWAGAPARARYPLELFEWSPDGRAVAFRGRADPFATETPLFVADAASGAVRPVASPSVGGPDAGIDISRPSAAMWIDDRRLLVRGSAGGWRIVGSGGEDRALTAGAAAAPEAFLRAQDGSLVGLAGRSLMRLVPETGGLTEVKRFDGDVVLPPVGDPGAPDPRRLLALAQRDGWRFTMLDALTGETWGNAPASMSDLPDVDLRHGLVLGLDAGRAGTALRAVDLAGATVRDLLTVNTHLRAVAWGEKRLIDYKGANGEALKAVVILPPGYRPGHRYPTLAWIYGGYQVRSLDGNFVTDDDMPGFYNLQLYAAKGYVVLVPSMPIDRGRTPREDYRQIPGGVMPAIDKLVDMGIADPDRLGTFGQSFGGYSVYAILSQTDRFKAGVAIAGLTDLSSNYGEFDPTARGYPGIEHEKSVNWTIGSTLGQDGPWAKPDEYARNSPLHYADKVSTPLLMLHGDHDIRGSHTQAEQFFFALYQQGKTAELVRYGGESHSIALSPANVRDVYGRILAWFDRYLPATVAK